MSGGPEEAKLGVVDRFRDALCRDFSDPVKEYQQALDKQRHTEDTDRAVEMTTIKRAEQARRRADRTGPSESADRGLLPPTPHRPARPLSAESHRYL